MLMPGRYYIWKCVFRANICSSQSGYMGQGLLSAGTAPQGRPVRPAGSVLDGPSAEPCSSPDMLGRDNAFSGLES